MIGGWIKAHRAMRGHPMLQSATRKGVWIDLLLMAAHQPARVLLRGKFVDLATGQAAVVMGDWAQSLGLTPRQMERILDSFVEDGAVVKMSGPGKAYTLLTVSNYNVYQVPSGDAGGSSDQSEEGGKVGGRTGGSSGYKEGEGRQVVTTGEHKENSPSQDDDGERSVEAAGEGLVENGGREQEVQELRKIESTNVDSPHVGFASAVVEPDEPSKPLPLKDRFPTKGRLPKNGRGASWPAEFEAAWQAYPVRSQDSRGACYAHWRKAVVDERIPPDRIIDGAEAYADVWAGQEYRWGFRRWLEERSWNHPVPTLGTNGRGGGGGGKPQKSDAELGNEMFLESLAEMEARGHG